MNEMAYGALMDRKIKRKIRIKEKIRSFNNAKPKEKVQGKMNVR
jgi:hypothetical protein